MSEDRPDLPSLPPPPPVPLLRGRPPTPARGWRTTIAVATVILVVVLGVNVADAAIPLPDNPARIDVPAVPDASFPDAPPGGPDASLTPVGRGPVESGEQIDVGQGYTIRPPGGWTLVSQHDQVTVLQKGAAVLVVETIRSEETPEDLAQRYRDAWFKDGSYTGGDAESRTVGRGIPAAELDYTGAFQGTAVDGRIVTAVTGGAGLVLNAFAPTGTLAQVAPDLETIVSSVGHGGG